MHRTFISTIIAAALTITGISSTMAQAGEYRRAPQVHTRNQNTIDPVAAALFGAIALAIVGKTIENNGGFKKKAQPQKQYVQPQRSHKQQRAHNNQRRNEGHRAQRGHNNHRQFSHNNRRANDWHRHGNGRGHKHPHGPRHHRGRH